MPRTPLLLLLLALSFCMLMETPLLAHGEEAGFEAEPMVRIGLVDGVTRLTVSVQGNGGSLSDALSNEGLGSIKAGEVLTVDAAGESVKWAGKKAGALRIEAADDASRVMLNGKPYRGHLVIRPWAGKLVGVNYCRLDDYLYGVVPWEMPSDWPSEALKAQSVAARTYAVKRLGQLKTAHGFYDLMPDTADQVYEGCRRERETTNNAIDATSGLILTWDNEPIVAYFHSQSGEATINGTALRGERTDFPYLRGVPSRETGFRRWVVSSTVSELQRLLKSKGGYKIGDIRFVAEHAYDSGLLQITHSDGVLDLPRNSLRWLYGSQQFLSPNFRLEISPEPKDPAKPLSSNTKLQFIGTGWGHGVGMSQHGAKGYAEEGWDYRRILAHYYRGTQLSIWFDMSGWCNLEH